MGRDRSNSGPQRSGLNVNGSLKYWGLRCITQEEIKTRLPAGTLQRSILSSVMARRTMTPAGGQYLRTSLMTFSIYPIWEIFREAGTLPAMTNWISREI